MTDRTILSVDSGVAGYEPEEVSDAKDEVMDLVYEAITSAFFATDYEGVDDFDSIGLAETIVERLIELGWRPTKEG